MAVPNRHGSPPGTYFVTSGTWEGRRLFINEPSCRIFVETLLHYRDEDRYALHAFVLMPHHFHMLVTPSATTTLARVVQYIKGGSAHRIRKELIFRFPVWQRGFSDRRIRDAEDYDIHLRYIEQNPAKRGLVASPSDYVWSSASSRYRLDGPPQRLKPPLVAAAFRHG